MLKSLSARLAFFVSFLFLLAGFILTLVFFNTSQQYAEEVEQQLHRQLATHVVKDDPQLAAGVIDASSLENAFHTMMLLGPAWELYALDLDGKILAFSAPPGKVVRQDISLGPIQSYFAGSAFPLYGDDPRNPEGQKIFSVAPIKNVENQKVGYLYVIIGSEKRDSLETLIGSSHVLKDGAVTVLLAVLCGLILLLVTMKMLNSPLDKFIARMKSFVKNDYRLIDVADKELTNAPSEVKLLNTAFEQTAQHIEEQLQQIKTTEQLRRELLSHVSHDLRTPLASLHGYLETWLLQQPEARQQDLIEVALKNAGQLNLLVDQLFELARLESGDIKVQPEPISLAELLHDVVSRLAFQAQQRSVTVNVITEQTGLVVEADIAQLERVLVNLIENAIRHCPENGHVSVCASGQGALVAVEVKDNGCGIAEAEMVNIFEPRFRGTNSRGAGGHAGLGLAIVKRLLTMNNGDIEVESELNQGTAFRFRLPVAA